MTTWLTTNVNGDTDRLDDIPDSVAARYLLLDKAGIVCSPSESVEDGNANRDITIFNVFSSPT
ncbi:MAG: hypothetical protein P8Y45_22845, partial [Exilibacterium sp.]